MNMSIIAASRLRQPPKVYNTFIGGVGNLYPDAQTFYDGVVSSDLGVVASDLQNYEVDTNNNIRFFIDKDYVLRINKLPNQGLAYYVDLEGRCVDPQNNMQNKPNKFIYFPNASPENFSLRQLGNALMAYPNATFIGSTVGDNDVFSTLTFGHLITNKTLETINGGNPDGDIVELLSNGGSVTYKDLTDPNQTTPPNAPTISTNTIGGTYVELNVSQPTHVNTLKYALVFVNGFFQDVYDINSAIYALSLQQQTSYDIKVIIADEYFNISPYSNTLNVTTTTTPALFQNAVAYYKLDETNDDAADVVNGYNGNDVGTIVKDGEWYDYGTNESYVEIADNDDFSFTDGTSATDFVIKTEVIFDGFNSSNRAWLVSKRETTSAGSGNEWQINFNGTELIFAIWDDSNNIFVVRNNFTPVIGQKYILGATFINNELRLFVNGVRVATQAVTTPINFANSTSPVKLGNEIFTSNLNFIGRQKETTIIKGAGWTDGNISDNYNSGNGTTI